MEASINCSERSCQQLSSCINLIAMWHSVQHLAGSSRTHAQREV
jgi:hypothetical protein